MQLQERRVTAKDQKLAIIGYEKEQTQKYMQQQHILRSEQSRIKLEEASKQLNDAIDNKREKLEEKLLMNEQVNTEI